MYFSGILFRLLILISGNVHPNPGPDPHEQDTSVNTSTSSYAHILSSGLSIMHLNIQSLRPKLDILEVEAQLCDILVFTETWLSARVQNNDLDIPNYSLPFHCNREGKLGGGVAIYVRNGIHAVERQDLTIQGLEALWLEIKINNRKLIVGGIYRPPNANNNCWLLLEQSIVQAFNTNCDNLLVAGDFNVNIQPSSSNKMSRLISSYNAHQLIDSLTHSLRGQVQLSILYL